MKGDILKDKKCFDSVIEDILNQSNERKKSIEEIVRSIGSIEMTNENIDGKVQKIVVNMENIREKVKVLEDMNDIDPFKMKKIHDILDHELNFSDT